MLALGRIKRRGNTCRSFAAQFPQWKRRALSSSWSVSFSYLLKSPFLWGWGWHAQKGKNSKREDFNVLMSLLATSPASAPVVSWEP